MSIVDELTKGKIVTGLAIGVGAAVLAPVVLPMLSQLVKPVTKGIMKGGLLLFEKGREAAAETGEVVEDLWAEAKAEVSEELNSSNGPGDKDFVQN